MFTSHNPFAELSASIDPAVMQAYVIVMMVLVVAGTLYDVIHKGSARYFFDALAQRDEQGVETGRRRRDRIARDPDALRGSADLGGVLHRAGAEIAHLLTMYGFLAYVVTTVVMVFCYTAADTPAPAMVPSLWHIGALMVCVGGYWFWFFIRADVSAEGHSPFRVMHADLFILSLLASVTLGLVWSFLQGAGASWWTDVFFALYVIATTVLFASVPWSKFAHMFFKPAAALQKRVSEADGSRSKAAAAGRQAGGVRQRTPTAPELLITPSTRQLAESHADIRLHDALRRLWVTAWMSVLRTSCTSTRPTAAPTTSSPTCAGSATPASRPAPERHRRARLRGLRSAGPQRAGAARGGEGHDFLADRVP